MGPSSTAVDSGEASNFDRFASQNEEWIIRLRNLRDDEEKIKCTAQGNDESISNDPATTGRIAATRTILHVARLANLQCASAAYRERDCERKVITDVDRLHLHVQQVFDANSLHHKSMLESILHEASSETTNHQKVDEDASQSFFRDDDLCTDMEVDAFFDAYPECGRNLDKMDCSDSESDSDGEDSCRSVRRKRRTQSTQEIVSMTVDLVEAAAKPIEAQSAEHAQNHKQHAPHSRMASNEQLSTPMDIPPADQSTQNQARKTKPLSANNNHGNVDSSALPAIKNPYSNGNPHGKNAPSSSISGGKNSSNAIDLSTSTTSHDTNERNYSNEGTNNNNNNRSQNNHDRHHQTVQNPYNRASSKSNFKMRNSSDHQRQTNQNPYNRSSSQNNSNPSNNFYQQEDNNSRDAWRDHQNQTNPFQTAREVAIAEEKYPHRDPFRSRGGENRSKTQNSYNNPYGHEFQGRNNNPSDNFDEDHIAAPSTGGGPFIPESLKRKFQRPKRGLGSVSQGGANKPPNNRSLLRTSTNNSNNNSNGQRPSGSNTGGQTDKRNNSENKGGEEEDELPEELQHLDKELVKKIQNEIMESGDTVTFDDIAGLDDAKKTVREVVCWPMQRPDLFTGLRRAPNGLLLYGPPGTGKTLIGKAIAHESGATFFSISSSSLTSKWIGEGEKLVKTLFAVAAYNEPAVIFLDEIDSLLTQRKATENEASRRIKTEFLVQLDGCGTSGQGRVLIIGATNRPQELDEAARRRFIKRLYIPLPVEDDRKVLLGVLLKTNKHVLTANDIDTLARDTEGFSGADLKALCTDAAMGPIRQLGAKAMDINVNDVPPISYKHFKRSLKGTRPSVAQSDLQQYLEWDKEFGSKRCDDEDDDDDDDDNDDDNEQ